MTSAPILEPEQEALLLALARAHLAERKRFFVLRTLSNARIQHPQLPNGTYLLNDGDLRVLEAERLIVPITSDAGGVVTFAVTPTGVRTAEALAGNNLELVDSVRLRSREEILAQASATVGRTSSQAIRITSIDVVRGVIEDLLDREQDPARRGIAEACRAYMDVLEAFVQGRTDDESSVTAVARAVYRFATELGKQGAYGALAAGLLDVARTFLA